MKDSNKKIMFTACVLGALTIAIGAFGAHGLKSLVSPDKVTTFETGVRYQMYHVFGMLILGYTASGLKIDPKWIFRCFLGGLILFSGSIYLLALDEVLPFSTKWLGPVTPIGGLAFISGWALWALRLWKNRKTL